MKKLYKGLIVGAAALGLLAFTGCEDLLNLLEEAGGKDSNYEIIEATKTANWSYSDSDPVFEVTPDILKVNISNIPSGKTLYLVKRNAGYFSKKTFDNNVLMHEEMKFKDIRYIVSDNYGSIRSVTGEEMPSRVDFSDVEYTGYKHFRPPALPKIISYSSRSVLKNVNASCNVQSVEIQYKEGDTKKIWVDVNSEMNKYELKQATCKAVGSNCYIWVIDGSLGEVEATTIAKKYVSAFETIYPMITNIYGDESNMIYQLHDKYSANFVSMDSVSDTGTKINIVVYDIGASNNQVLGYFYAKDYMKGDITFGNIYDKSNVGKYFYIDSEFARKSSTFGDTVSTLAHEFQHMVNFGQKEMASGLRTTPSEWFNEMLSMLCEDMMNRKLISLGYATLENSPAKWFEDYNYHYYKSGITEWRNDDEGKGLSYPTSYSFGAWLVRQYGGAELISWLSGATDSNDKILVDEEAIVNAVNGVGNNKLSFDQIFEQYLVAITGSSVSHNSLYTLNKQSSVSDDLQYGSYNYSMSAIDIFSDTYASKVKNSWKNIKENAYSDYSGKGPFQFSNQYGVDLRGQNGITIHGIKKYESSKTDTITFSAKGAESLKMYLIIQ